MMVHLALNSFLLSLFIQAVPGPALRWNFTADAIGSLPSGWEIRGSSDKPIYQIKGEPDGNRYVAANSQKSDAQLGIQLDVRPQEYPILSWRWRVLELPPGGDERNQRTLDSAASVYAVFGSRLLPRVLKYVWSTSAPAGSVFKHPTSGRMTIFVVNSGAGSLGMWQSVRRDIAEDFKEAFGSTAGDLIALAVKTDSDSTRSAAQADYDDIQLTRR